MTDFQITRTKDEPGATTLTVQAPVEVVQAAEKKAAGYYARRVKLPGFRKGKAPPEIVRKRFGDAIRETVIQELVKDSWKQAVESESLEPVGDPEVHKLKFEIDQPVTFEFLVETKPEIKVERPGGFTVTRKVEPVTDEMILQQLERIQNQKAPWLPRDDGKPDLGDLVRVTIATPSADGEIGDEKPYDIVLGQDQALPAVEEAIMQLDVGESRPTSITFPADFPDETKRGQSIKTHITLHEVKRQNLPELDDDFAREVGDFETLEALKASIREDMERAATRDADASVRRDLIEQIATANQVPAPRPMVNRLLRAYAEAYQVPHEGFERFVSEFGPIVEHQVKRELVIQTVASQQHIEATEEDLDERVAEMATRQNTDAGKMYATLQRENRLRDLERDIIETRVFEYLIAQSTVQTA
jgi:trigger factor